MLAETASRTDGVETWKVEGCRRQHQPTRLQALDVCLHVRISDQVAVRTVDGNDVGLDLVECAREPSCFAVLHGQAANAGLSGDWDIGADASSVIRSRSRH